MLNTKQNMENGFHKAIVFSTEVENVDENTFVAHINIVTTSPKRLLNHLERKLKFPDYFGKNWDALNECLHDFSWIQENKIILYHKKFPEDFNDADLTIYLRILLRSSFFWHNKLWRRHYMEDRKEHELVIIFPPKFKDKFSLLLKDYDLEKI